MTKRAQVWIAKRPRVSEVFLTACVGLELQIAHWVAGHGGAHAATHIATAHIAGTHAGEVGAAGVFGFVDFEVDPGVVFGTDDFEEGADGTGGLALAADDIAHVLLIDEEGD